MPGAEKILVTLPLPTDVQPWGLLPDFLVGHRLSVSSLKDWNTSKSVPQVLHW
jgi:hypothetical protein